MNGNDARSQDYGQAIEDAADYAIRNAPEGNREFFEWVLEVLADGGESADDVLNNLAADLLAHDAFNKGIAKREGFQ